MGNFLEIVTQYGIRGSVNAETVEAALIEYDHRNAEHILRLYLVSGKIISADMEYITESHINTLGLPLVPRKTTESPDPDQT